MLRGRMHSQVRRHRTERSCELHRRMFVGCVEVLYACYKCSTILGTLMLWSIEEGGGNGDIHDYS